MRYDGPMKLPVACGALHNSCIVVQRSCGAAAKVRSDRDVLHQPDDVESGSWNSEADGRE